MSTKDKTRQKLMESMRKTKSGSSAKSDKVQAESKPQENKTVRKKSKKTVKTGAGRDRGKAEISCYQAGRRVWPD